MQSFGGRNFWYSHDSGGFCSCVSLYLGSTGCGVSIPSGMDYWFLADWGGSSVPSNFLIFAKLIIAYYGAYYACSNNSVLRIMPCQIIAYYGIIRYSIIRIIRYYVIRLTPCVLPLLFSRTRTPFFMHSFFSATTARYPEIFAPERGRRSALDHRTDFRAMSSIKS